MNQNNEAKNESQSIAHGSKPDSLLNLTLINQLKSLSTSELALIVLKARLAEQGKNSSQELLNPKESNTTGSIHQFKSNSIQS